MESETFVSKKESGIMTDREKLEKGFGICNTNGR